MPPSGLHCQISRPGRRSGQHIGARARESRMTSSQPLERRPRHHRVRYGEQAMRATSTATRAHERRVDHGAKVSKRLSGCRRRREPLDTSCARAASTGVLDLKRQPCVCRHYSLVYPWASTAWHAVQSDGDEINLAEAPPGDGSITCSPSRDDARPRNVLAVRHASTAASPSRLASGKSVLHLGRARTSGRPVGVYSRRNHSPVVHSSIA